MTFDSEDWFLTETNREYKWPYPIPMTERPPPPPLVTKPKNFYALKSEKCHCFAHQNQPQMPRYQDLLEAEKKLCRELRTVRNELDNLPHEEKSKLLTTYQTDYNPMGEGAPGGEQLEDSTKFKKSAFGEFDSKFCCPVHFDQAPKGTRDWFAPKTGRTEYQDNISKNGMSLLQNRQQYLEPIPSAKKRPGNTTSSFF